ncbi:MAG: undecaprenyldiphospho-muramoylpentapeptide beta-N-acetylglucosaminyltransferase [Chloroflexota bacterium]
MLFTTGGYVAIPALIAAALTRTPSVIWEGNVEAGRSNRLIAPLATARAVAWAETRARAPWDGAGTHLTGTPVRDLSGTSRAAARAELGLADGDRLLLVFGGSQRVLRFEQALDGALAAILPRWKVLHVTGTDGVGAEARRAALPAELRDRYRTTAFLERGEMERALVASDLLLGRAGASTIAEASAVGLPSIIVPYPYAGGHQRANAAALADAGGATLVADRDLTAERLVAAIAPFDDVAHRARVGAAARALAHPEAARTIAELLVDTAAARAPRGRRP